MRNNKLNHIYLLVSFFIILILSLFLASFLATAASIGKIGNLSDSIQEKYTPNEIIKGKINLSLNNDNANSVISGANASLKLLDFLIGSGFINGVHFDCDVSNCGSGYETKGAGATSTSFTLGSGESKTIGLKVKSPSNFNGFSLGFSSTNSESCSSPLFVDFFDNNATRWTSNIISPSFSNCSSENYGCYNPARLAGSVAIQLNSSYCEKISINSAASLRVGAEITGTGSATFLFYLDETDIDSSSSCSATATGSGKISCIIKKSIIEPENISLCMMRVDGASYSINYEDYNKEAICGYSEVLGNPIERDSPIFGQPIKFGAIASAVVNSSYYSAYSSEEDYLEKEMENYLSGSDCSDWCVVPVSFISNINSQQTIDVSNLRVSYVDMPFRDIYELNKVNAKISMASSLIDVAAINMRAPVLAGFYNITIKLNNNSLLTKRIEVLNAPVINSISLGEIQSEIVLAGNGSALNVPAGAEISFVAAVSGSNITSYKWNFGDNSAEQTTTTNKVKHKYSGLGSYSLKLSASNSYGENNASFSVVSVSPKEYLNSSLVSYKSNIASIKTKVSELPVLVKNAANKIFDINNKEIKIQELQIQYDSAGNDSAKYITILDQLYAVNIPSDIKVSSEASGKFVPDKSKVNLANMKSLTGESIDYSETSLKEAVFGWALENLDIDANLKVYSALYKDNYSAFASDISVDITNKGKASKVYAVINEAKDSIEISGLTLSALSGAAGASFDIGNGKSFEFVIPKEVGILDIPIYFSGPISELAFELNVSGCNNNNICEKSRLENSSNCRNDCKPWKLAWLYIVIALFVVFCLYIACQEWYKRKYEAYLFKNSNDLYNLIQFVSNANKQQLNMSAALVKLTEKGWTGEQIAYAYNKFRGKRTGMWEIPIFKFLENRKVNEEIKKRELQQNNQANQLSQISPTMQKNIGIKPGMTFKPKTDGLNNAPKPPLSFSRQPIKPVDIQKKIFGVPPKVEAVRKDTSQEIRQEKTEEKKENEQKNEQKNILTQKPISENKQAENKDK